MNEPLKRIASRISDLALELDVATQGLVRLLHSDGLLSDGEVKELTQCFSRGKTPPMIFTIGRQKTYDQYVREQKSPTAEKSAGGTVWRTFAEAQRACSEGYAVYGLETSWDAAEPDPLNPGLFQLKHDAVLIPREKTAQLAQQSTP